MELYDNSIGVEYRINFFMSKIGSKVRVEDIWDIVFEDYQIWYDIPQFPQYQISNYGNIRSLKQSNKYKYGTLPRYIQAENRFDRIYKLVNYDNIKVDITLLDIIRLVDNYVETNKSIIGYTFKEVYEGSNGFIRKQLSDMEYGEIVRLIAGDKPKEAPKQLINPLQFFQIVVSKGE